MATSYPGAIDAFNNPTANTAEDATGYEHDLQHSNVNDAVEAIETELGTNPSGTYSTVGARLDDMQNKDSIYKPYGTPTYADEFDGTSIDSGWVRADYSGDAGHLTWTHSNGVLSAEHTNIADAAGGRMHAMLRPVGTAFAPGDAVVTSFRSAIQYAVQYLFVGVGVTDGTTHGTSTIVQAETYTTTSHASSGLLRVNVNAGMNADTLYSAGLGTNPFQGPMWIRLVMTSANNWRVDFSPDGISWVRHNTLTYTLTPTHMGLFVSNWTSSYPYAVSFQTFRRYSGVS